MAEVALTQVQALERQLNDAKQLVARRQMALRLYDNRDFRKLVMEGFCRDEAARYVQASGDPALSGEQRMDALNMAQASGHLLRFMSICVQMAAVAERDLPEIEGALAEARAEEGAAA